MTPTVVRPRPSPGASTSGAESDSGRARGARPIATMPPRSTMSAPRSVGRKRGPGPPAAVLSESSQAMTTVTAPSAAAPAPMIRLPSQLTAPAPSDRAARPVAAGPPAPRRARRSLLLEHPELGDDGLVDLLLPVDRLEEGVADEPAVLEHALLEEVLPPRVGLPHLVEDVDPEVDDRIGQVSRPAQGAPLVAHHRHAQLLHRRDLRETLEPFLVGHRERPHLAGLQLPDALVRIRPRRVDVAPEKVRHHLPAALERQVGEVHLRGLAQVDVRDVIDLA